nr:ABC transporter ATP-binding protein [Micromonospora sp. DSM 115978]
MLIRLLRRYLRPYTRPMAVVVVLQLIGTIASLYLPSLNGDLIDRGIAVGDTGYILRVGGWMLAVTAVQMACAIAAVFYGARTAMAFGRDLRSAVFGQVGRFSAREVGQFGAPSLITRTTNDVQQVQMLVVLTFTMLVAAPIMCVGGIVMALREDLGLSWLMVVSVPILALLVGLIVRRMVPLFRAMQTRIDTVNRVLREQITGIRVVRAFVREPEETARFATANADLTGTALRVGRLQALIFPVVMLVLNVSGVAVLWFGAGRVDSGQIEVGALTAFLSYLMQILMSVMMATFMLMMVPRAAVSAERITEVLQTRPSVVPPAKPATAPGASAGAGPGNPPELELRGVGFQYPGAAAPVLRDVSFRASAGLTTAIIGSTGAGKSTLLSMVPRLFDATAGSVLVDGVDVRDLDPETLRGRIGMVPQRPYLFTGTVASNLRYGRPEATDEELWDALRVAQADEFVAALPDGLAAPIAQGGTNLSGGQRQRLAIARALVRRPGIYLFDDSFSALDLGTDARLRDALRPVTADAAVVIVAQRVSTIIDADQIVVLEDGVVAGIGRHADLLGTCPTYAEIVASQFTVGAPA